MNEYVQVVFMLHCRNPAKALQSKDFLSIASLLMSVSGVRFGWPPTNKISSPSSKTVFVSLGFISPLEEGPQGFWLNDHQDNGWRSSHQSTTHLHLELFVFFVSRNAKVVVTNRRYWKFSWDRLCAYYVCMCVCVKNHAKEWGVR